jgi:hypothetical protein
MIHHKHATPTPPIEITNSHISVLYTGHPWAALSLDIVAVEKRESPLDRCQNRVKELFVELCRVTSRAWASKEVVVGCVVTQITNNILMSDVNSLETESLRHNDPMLRSGVALSWHDWALVEESAVHTKVVESLDQNQSQMGV